MNSLPIPLSALQRGGVKAYMYTVYMFASVLKDDIGDGLRRKKELF